MKSCVSIRSACVDLNTVVWDEIWNTLRAQAVPDMSVLDGWNPSRSLMPSGTMESVSMQCVYAFVKRQESVSGLSELGNRSLWKPRDGCLKWVLWIYIRFVWRYGSLKRPCSKKQTKKVTSQNKWPLAYGGERVGTGPRRRIAQWKVKRKKGWGCTIGRRNVLHQHFCASTGDMAI